MTAWAADFEEGNLTEFTGSTTDSGDLAATAGSALHGSYGSAWVIDDTTELQLYYNLSNPAVHELRFYFDVNSLTMGTGEEFYLFNLYQRAGSYYSTCRFTIEKAAGSYRVKFSAYNDAGTLLLGSYFNITDAPHYFEFKVVRATNSTSNDGTFEWWIDGVSQETATGVDNYNRLFDQNMRLLWQSGAIDAGTSGTFYVDTIDWNDTGTYIGPVVTSAISKINGTAIASIAKIAGIAIASVAKVNGVEI